MNNATLFQAHFVLFRLNIKSVITLFGCLGIEEQLSLFVTYGALKNEILMFSTLEAVFLDRFPNLVSVVVVVDIFISAINSTSAHKFGKLLSILPEVTPT